MGAGFEYGRLEVFLRGFWSNICDQPRFTPEAAQVACSILGYDGGAAPRFRAAFAAALDNQVRCSTFVVQ